MTEPTNLPVVIAYADYHRPDIAEFILEAVNGYEDWEMETIIAAEAIYAANFLNPN